MLVFWIIVTKPFLPQTKLAPIRVSSTVWSLNFVNSFQHAFWVASNESVAHSPLFTRVQWIFGGIIGEYYAWYFFDLSSIIHGQGFSPKTCTIVMWFRHFWVDLFEDFFDRFTQFTFFDLELISFLRYWIIDVYRVELHFATRLGIDFLWWYKLFSQFSAHLCLLYTNLVGIDLLIIFPPSWFSISSWFLLPGWVILVASVRVQSFSSYHL